MKKGILCILLSICLLTPFFTACDKGSTSTGKKATIYTLYTIVGEETTDEAIRQVELSLNYTIFYRYGVILDIKTAKSEEEYYEMIDGTFDALEKKDEDVSEASKEEASASDKIYTGDDILKLLENGKDIPETASPRLDIFLVTDFDRYYQYAVDEKLTELDTSLNNEGKELTSQIHGTFFNAAKVNGNIYGIPVNAPIGENTYFVFDKELFEGQDVVDITTINSLKDLEAYFALIKETHPDVVPLKSLGANIETNFLINEGFPAIVNNGTVSDAYTNPNFNKYLSMVAKYNALGYIGNAETDNENTRYAVRIETGNKDNFDPDKEIVVEYSKPIATIDNTIQGIYCISKYVSSNELTELVSIFTSLCTQEKLVNLLIYGVEGTHYELDDNGQVHRLANEKGDYTYVVNPYYMGNPFKAYTLDTEPKTKWKDIIAHNREVIASPSLGYVTSYLSWPYLDEDLKQSMLEEPDYIAIVNQVVDKYYTNALSDGSWLAKEFANPDSTINTQYTSYEDLVAQCTESAKTELTNNLIKYYVDYVVTPMAKKDIEATVRAEIYDSTYAEKEAEVREVAANNPDNPDFNSEEKIVAIIEEQVEIVINDEVTKRAQAQIGELDLAGLTSLITSDARYASIVNKFNTDVAEMETIDLPRKTAANIDAIITTYLKAYIKLMVEEINTAIDAEVNAFFEAHKDDLSCETIEDFYCMIGYYETVTAEGEGTEGEGTEGDASGESSEATDNSDTSEGENGEDGDNTENTGNYKALYQSWYEFVIKGKVTSSYNTSFGITTN